MKKTHTRITALLGALAMAAWGIGMTGCFTSINDSDDNSGGSGGKYELLVDGGPSGRIATTAPATHEPISVSSTSTYAISRAVVPLAAAGTYDSLAKALAAAEQASGSVVITLAPGTYDATGLKYKGKNDLTIRGASSTDYGTDVLIVGMGSNMSQESTRSLLSFEGSANIVLENLTLKNSYGETTGTAQAETLGVSNNVFTGTLAVYNCSFLSGQDTICTQGKAWFYHCYIEGDVDFIWMEGTKPGARVALYEECIIRAIGTRSSSAYIAAPRLAKENSVWKGVVFYNSILQAETGLKNFYLGRNPWDGSSDYYENVAIVACRLQLASGVTLHSDIWKGNAYGTSNQQHIGFKTDEYFTKSAAGHGARLTSAHIAADYAGRENILNRYYDFNAAKFKQDAEAYWDINALIAARGWNVTLDTSSSLATGETKVKSVVYTFSQGTSGVDVTSSTGNTSGFAWSGFTTWNSSHGPQGNGTITLTLTEPSVITLKACQYNSSGTIATTGVTQKEFKGASDGESQNILYTGNGGTLTISFTGTVYLHDQIVVKTLTDETNGVASVSLSDAAVIAGGDTTLTATVTTKYLNDLTYSTTWTTSDAETVSITGNGTMCIATGKKVGSAKVTATAGGVSGTCTVTVNSADAQPETATYTLTGTVGTPYTSSDGFLKVTASSDNGQHGLIMKKDSNFTLKVRAGAKITLGNCAYDNAQSITITNTATQTLDTLSISEGDSSNDNTSTAFTYSGSSTDTLTFTWTGSSGQNYLHYVKVEY